MDEIMLIRFTKLFLESAVNTKEGFLFSDEEGTEIISILVDADYIA